TPLMPRLKGKLVAPVLLMVKAWAAVDEPALIDPKEKLPGVMLTSWGGAVPVSAAETATGVPKDSAATLVPDEPGAKRTKVVQVAPAGSDARPSQLPPATSWKSVASLPVRLSEKTKDVDPVLVRVNCWLMVNCPGATLPKLKLLGV